MIFTKSSGEVIFSLTDKEPSVNGNTNVAIDVIETLIEGKQVKTTYTVPVIVKGIIPKFVNLGDGDSDETGGLLDGDAININIDSTIVRPTISVESIDAFGEVTLKFS